MSLMYFRSAVSSVPLLASPSWCLIASFFPVPRSGCSWAFTCGSFCWVRDSRVRGRASVAHFQRGSFRVFSTVFFIVVLLLGAQLTPVLWQIGYAGVPVEEASHPTEVSPCVVSTNPGSQSLTSAPTPNQPLNPYAAVPGSPSRASWQAQPLLLLPLSLATCPAVPPPPLPATAVAAALPRTPLRSRFLISPPGPGSSRLFCPVAACPDHAPPSHGWASFHSIQPHIEAHMAGQLLGEVPPGWLRSQGCGTCEVCQRGTDSRPLAERAPTIWDVFTGGPRVRSSVPRRCALCLVSLPCHRPLGLRRAP